MNNENKEINKENSMLDNLKYEPFTKKYWRSTAAWLYLLICFCDFILFPILWSAILYKSGATISAYQPLTLTAGGLIHVAFGALLSIYSWTRGQEILEQTRNQNRRNPRQESPYQEDEEFNVSNPRNRR